MANYCENTLTVIGKPKDIVEFSNLVYTENGANPLPLDFNKIIPYPEDLAYLDRFWHEEYKKTGEFPSWKNGFNSGGLEWCVENWGTKWNAMYTHCETSGSNEIDIDTRDNKLYNVTYDFDTAWSPPIPVVAKMAEMFPTLEFELEYEEGGEGFKGSNSFADGKQIAADVYYFESENEEEYEQYQIIPL